MAKRMTYKSAGVDIALKQALIPLFRAIARPIWCAFGRARDRRRRRLRRADRAERRPQDARPVLVAGTDSVGTKLKIAFATGRHDTVGIDCVAMCVNDIICHAARPLFFLDYIGIGKLEKKDRARYRQGRRARMRARRRMSLVGGETAQLSGLYKPGEYDLAGFAVGIVERANIPDPRRFAPATRSIGIASSGLHSNGFSLARMVLLERAQAQAGRAISTNSDARSAKNCCVPR